MIDYVGLETAWQARIRAEIPAFAKVANGSELPLGDAEKLKMALRAIIPPACFTEVYEDPDVDVQKVAVGSGSKAVIETVRYVAGIVTRSYYSPTAPAQSGKVLKQLVKKCGQLWPPPGAMRPLFLRRVIVVGDVGDRHLIQIEFDTRFHENFS